MKLIKRIPLAISGLSLAFFSMGSLLLPRGIVLHNICSVLATLLLFLFLLRFFCDFKNVKEELKTPVVLSVLPTSTMSLMLFCSFIYPYFSYSIYLWYLAIILHITIMILFIKRFIVGFDIHNVFPSWFIIGVGIVVSSVTSVTMNKEALGHVTLCIGILLYCIILPVVVYRMIKIKQIPDHVRPTIAIFTAPMSLILTGYLLVIEQPKAIVVYIMLLIAVLCYLYVSVMMVSLLRISFYPSYVAFTFPFVISATAFKYANFFLLYEGHSYFNVIHIITEAIAIILVIYVLIRYIIFLFSKERS